MMAVKGLRTFRDGEPRTATATFTQLLSSECACHKRVGFIAVANPSVATYRVLSSPTFGKRLVASWVVT